MTWQFVYRRVYRRALLSFPLFFLPSSSPSFFPRERLSSPTLPPTTGDKNLFSSLSPSSLSSTSLVTIRSGCAGVGEEMAGEGEERESGKEREKKKLKEEASSLMPAETVVS